MLKLILIALLPFLGVFSDGSDNLFSEQIQNTRGGETGTLEKMIVANGSVAMELNLKHLNGLRTGKVAKQSLLRFEVEQDSFFTVLVFNNELRGPVPSSMKLIPQNSADLPAKLKASHEQLVVENTPWGGQYEMVVRDEKTGFVFFNIEGQDYNYDAEQSSFGVQNGRLLISNDFAVALGRPADAGSVAGRISISASMRTIEITQFVNDEVVSEVLPSQPTAGSVPGPDVIVGDLNGLSQPTTTAAGTQVGISVGTDSCNVGAVDLDWFASPNNNHPVIPQNLYRMSGGPTNDERFEQIGQSSVKHAFTALTENICSLGCNGVGGTHLGSGCSDPYVVSLNSGGSSHNLGSRAWINPFTGVFPRADSATPPNSHTGHTHNAVSHRMVVEISDLSTTLNPGATYYAEAQYITPHEYVWCQAHPGQCNMYNNVSFRRYNVNGTGSPFSFSAAAATVRAKAAIITWTGATEVTIEPATGQDGTGVVAYKVTNPSPGVWHYEYAVYNQNLDRSIQSFSVPVGAAVSVSNIGFHAPPQHPGSTADGTEGSAGFSSTPWTQTLVPGSMTWNSETFAQNPNANAIRWGTMYNFRFDSNVAPQTVNATIGFFKTGSPITVQVQGPGIPAATPTPTPTPTPFPEIDLRVSQSASAGPVTVGSQLTYTVTASIFPSALGGNASPQVRFNFPTGVPVVLSSVSGTNGFVASPDATGITFAGGSISTSGINPGSATLLVTVTPQSAGTLTSLGTNVVIDPNNLVSEDNETNNTAQTIQTSVVAAGVLVSVSGRVTAPDGRGLQNLIVKITDANGVTRSATTSSFGFYSFDNVQIGQSYTLTVTSRLYRFVRQVMQVSGNLSDVDFIGLE